MLSVARTTAFRSRQSLAFLAMSLVMTSVPRPAAAADEPLEIAPAIELGVAKGAETADKPSSSGPSPEDLTYAPEQAILGQSYGGEVEPNGTFATASPLSGTNGVVRANLFPNGDIDFYSFTAAAGDRIYAATMTSNSSGNSTDAQLTLLASDGTTVIEFDDDNGTFAGLSPSIANAAIPTAGTYFFRLNDFTAGTTSERPYEFHFRIQSGAETPTPEVEANDTPATANPLPANGWVSGTRNPAAATEQDWYSFTANAGDTVYLSLDVNPERDATVWNGRLGIALFGDAANQILVVDDAGTGDVTPVPNNPSEAMFLTVKTAGTYFAFVDSASAATGGPTATYTLSVSIHPATNEGVNCTTYTSTDVPKTIGPGTGIVSSVITVPGNPRIADLDVEIVLNHALMQDIDAHLRSPAGNDNGLFTDIGAAAVGGQAQMDITFDDEAGISLPAFTALRNIQMKPENNSTAGTASTSGGYRLSWFDGEDAGGTWTLDLRDDTAGANGGTLTSWSLRICEVPPPPACGPGFTTQTVFSTDFESGPAGFTHSGPQDEWELGLPATVATTTANPVAAFNTCNSGVNCWKTDLDNTYNASSNQDLLSPAIDLSGLSAPVVVSWAQKHQIESTNFDRMSVDFQQVGGATPVRLYEWLDPTPISASAGTGNPQANIGGSVGWGIYSRRADSLAGLNSELRFHLDTDTTVQFGGLAVDDVTVTACRPLSADLSITKDDGVTSVTPNQNITYTITASNAGGDPVTAATVADTFPANINCPTWTCSGAGGGTCTAAGSGNINDTVNLPAGGSVTYLANCSVASSAIGVVVNTATVSSSVPDPVPGNNSATDTDAVTQVSDFAITKTDGVASAVPGESVTYTIVASNAGPSNGPSTQVADTFPAGLTCTWTCAGAGGGTCTAAGAGNILDLTNLPAGGSVTYTAPCAISAAATGTLANTATVSSIASTDPDPANNSATDTDTLAGQSDASLDMTVDNATPTLGTNVTYTVSANNDGPSDAHAVTVTDLLPNGLTFVSATPSQGTYSSGTGAWAIGTLADTQTVTLALVATVNSSQAIVNQASVTAQTEADPNRSNNSALVAINSPGLADVQLQQTVDDDTPASGANVTFTISAHNDGPTAATNVIVTDNQPTGLTFVSATPSQGTYDSGTGAWNVGTIASGATPTLTVVATVTTTSPIFRIVQKTQIEPDYASDNDTDSVSLNDDTVADLAMSLVASQEPVPQGTSFTYTITVSNHGPASATNVVVTDVLPAGVTLNSATATQGSCSGTTTVTCNLGTLPDGLSANVVLLVTKTVGGNVLNTASVAATETDPFMPNNSNSETSTPAELTNFRVE
jgi:uncharacterized repeat protein (TIGR01451 family)